MQTRMKSAQIDIMQNKFSNCFKWVGPSTSDLKIHLLAWRYKHRSPDKDFH